MNEMVRMRHPDGYSCGWNGIAYQPDERGIVTVDHAAVTDLQNFGFRRVPDEPAAVSVGDDGFKEWLHDVVETSVAAKAAIEPYHEPEPDIEEPSRYRSKK